ncbi:MAG TPA: protein phosphatase 2C domain-containing protein [Gemmataceae bacterium]|nr:protein phosphatase 2C domain-containing protein [Gemmataceae bacterium]
MNPQSLPDTGEYVSPAPGLKGPPASNSSRVRVEFGAATHRGRVRPNNEDSYLIARAERSLEVLATNIPPGDVPTRSAEVTYGMGVADGLGGSLAGEVASRLALTAFVNLTLHTPDWIMRGGEAEAERLLERIAERYRQVGATITTYAEGDAALVGMATTMTLAATNGQDLYIGHVGDSRAYICRDGRLVRLTRDHTYAQTLVDAGLIREDDVRANRCRHILTRALGPTGDRVDVDVAQGVIHDGDQLLLCTDGLTGMVSEDKIAALLGHGSATGASQALVDAALAAGGKDNVTVVLARYRIAPET